MSSLIDQLEDHLGDGEHAVDPDVVWRALSMGAGVLSAVAARKAVAAVWRSVKGDEPEDPTDPATDWGTALLWAVLSGVGAGVARLVGQRTAARTWTRLTGTPPPGTGA